MLRHISIIPFGSIENGFTVAAGMVLGGGNVSNILVVTDGDKYISQEERRKQIEKVLSGNENWHEERVEKALSIITQFDLPINTAPEKYIWEILKKSTDESEYVECAKRIKAVSDTHEYIGEIKKEINCQVDNAFEQMKETKKKFNKTDKRQAYHIILSFKEGEVSPDTVFELTERFVKEYLGNDYEAVFAVHDNTEHPHSHIVFNSVSFRDGKKYHYQKVQTAIAVSEDTITKEPIEKEQAKVLTEMIRSLTEAVQSHTGNYETIEKLLKQMETIRLDEAVAKNLTSLNEKLEKENREFTEQLEGKQNEVNKGLQTIAQLRTELENLKKEMKIMQDRNTDLEQQISQRDETIREQGQAIIAKNSAIEKYKSAEEKAADEQHHEKTVLQEETVEKQPENEMKPNYDSQAVGQTQGAIPKQAATIPAGAIPVYANAGGIPVYYTMTLVQDQKVLQRTDVDYMHRNRALTYVSTEGEPAIKAYELEQANAAKAKGKMFGASGKADVSVSDEIDTDKKKNSQAEFEASKKKMMRMLIICMIFIVLLVGVAVAYKLGYLAPLISYVTKK